MSNNELGKAMDRIQDKNVRQDDETATKDFAESSRKESSKRRRRPVKPEGFKEFKKTGKRHYRS